MRTADPLVPLSWGEVIDKITILEIKTQHLTNPRALANVALELERLTAVAAHAGVLDDTVLRLKHGLAELNGRLWNIENAIRAKEAAGAFDTEFIELARSVYRINDRRGAAKREINLYLGAALIEEKQYTLY